MASAWTGAQFLNGTELSGNALGLRIAAGNVWVANNWNRPDEGVKEVPDGALSTRFGGNGAVVFFGLAKPVRTPLVGPVQPIRHSSRAYYMLHAYAGGRLSIRACGKPRRRQPKTVLHLSGKPLRVFVACRRHYAHHFSNDS